MTFCRNYLVVMLKGEKIEFDFFVYIGTELGLEITCGFCQAKVAISCKSTLAVLIALKISSWRFCTTPNPNIQTNLPSVNSRHITDFLFIDLYCSDVPAILIGRRLLTDSHHTEHQRGVEKTLYYLIIDLIVSCKKSLLGTTTESPPRLTTTVTPTTTDNRCYISVRPKALLVCP